MQVPPISHRDRHDLEWLLPLLCAASGAFVVWIFSLAVEVFT